MGGLEGLEIRLLLCETDSCQLTQHSYEHLQVPPCSTLNYWGEGCTCQPCSTLNYWGDGDHIPTNGEVALATMFHTQLLGRGWHLPPCSTTNGEVALATMFHTQLLGRGTLATMFHTQQTSPWWLDMGLEHGSKVASYHYQESGEIDVIRGCSNNYYVDSRTDC